MKKKNRRLTLAFDRLLSKSLAKQLLILVGVMLILFALSHIALNLAGDDWKTYCDQKNISRWVFPLYLLIDANAFNDLYTTDVHQISKLTLAISGITFVAGILLFTGALISILTNVISQRVERYNDGLIPYLKSGHYIIMGYDDMVVSIISNIFERDPKAYVLLLTAVDAKIIHEKLRKTFTEKQTEQIIINYGLRTSKEYYGDIHLEAAEEVFIVGLRSLTTHDAMNVENIDSICSYLKNNVKSGMKPKRITCVFEDLDTYASFKTTEIFLQVRDLDIEFVPYNFYSGWANQVLRKQQYREKSRPDEVFRYPSVYRNGIKDEDTKFVHLVFVGITNLSAAFAMEAAHLLHFPNFNEKNQKPKTRITFIDIVVDEEMPEFITRNRHLFEVQSYIYKDLTQEAPKPNDEKETTSEDSEPAKEIVVTDSLSQQFKQHDFLDVEFEFIKGNVFSAKVQKEIRNWACLDDRYLSIFLTMSDQRKNFMMGMNMPDEVYDREIPVFIRQDRSDNFVTNLRIAEENHFKKKGTKHFSASGKKVEGKDYHGRYANIFPFGMSGMAFDIDETSIKRAKLINFLYDTADYDNNHFLDATVLAAMTTESIWKKADEAWKGLTVALKWSNLYCAYSIPVKMASVRAMRKLDPNDTSHDKDELSKDEIQAIAHVEHNRWNVEKLLMGFRKACEDDDYYSYEEANKTEPDYNSSEAKKLKKNKNIYIHHDIRPFDGLDKATQQLDLEIAKYIPWILKMTAI